MTLKTKTKKLVAFVGLATIAGFSQGSSTAFAAGDACSTSYPDATTVGDGVCEVTYLTTPASAFKVPASVAALQVLLVGGGAGTTVGYAGGGGDVKIFNLANEGEIDVVVATAAVAGADGNSSSITLLGTTQTALGGSTNGTSGNGNATASGTSNPGAGGAGGPGGRDVGNNSVGDIGVNPANDPTINGGLGIIVKDIEGATLFADDTNCYGGGGANSSFISGDGDLLAAWNGVATCGAGSSILNVVNDTSTAVEPIANSGGGSGASWMDTAGRAGSSGRVVFRYTLEAAPVDETPTEGGSLAQTGGSVDAAPLVFGFGMLAAGLLALGIRLKKIKN